MKAYNSTLKRGKPIQRKPFLKGSSKPKGKGLVSRVAEACGTLIKHKKKEPSLLRCEIHRRNVVSLGCLVTGRPAQACHVNFGKGMGLKTCDSLCFPLSPELHAYHDQGGLTRQERWKREWEYADMTRAQLIAKGLWPAEVEAHYQKAIKPLARVVHGE